MYQRTIARSVEAIGTGIHKGKPILLRLEPLEVGSGIVFCRSDCEVEIPLGIEHIVDTSRATVIGAAECNISTIEHFLSVVYAYGIDNMRICVDSDEIPVMDGSAISFCLLLDEAGIRVQNQSKQVIEILKPVRVEEGQRFASLEPAQSASFSFEIDFPHPAIQRQSHLYYFSRKTFVEEIARARTFGFAKDIQNLQSRNLALGASLHNAIGLDNKKVLNKEGLRFKNEFVRHKILDAMGDMMVTGEHIVGKYTAFASSHKLNHALTKKLFSEKDNYRYVPVNQLQNPLYEVHFA